MARIRSIHPGFFADEDIVGVSMPARLLLIGLGVEADDKGVFPWKPLTIKMRVFPGDNIDVADLLIELAGAGIVREYAMEGKTFGAIRNFRKFQKPKTPNDIHPASEDILIFVGLKEGITEAPPKHFRNASEIAAQMEDGGGSRSSEANASGADAPNPSAADLTKAVWNSGKTILKAAGHDDRQAGSIIGRFRKDYSDSQVLTVLSRCQIEQPSEPVEWITKALQSERTRSNGQHPSLSRPTTRQSGERVAARFAAGCDGAVDLLPSPRAASGYDRG